MQLIGMGVVTMVFAVLGFLSPANRGGLMTAMLLLFVFMGIFGGYYSARLYKIFKVCAFLCLLTQLNHCAACLSWCLVTQPRHSYSPLVSKCPSCVNCMCESQVLCMYNFSPSERQGLRLCAIDKQR